MSLKQLNIQEEYRSDRDHLIQDFYIPCLEQSIAYYRAVGFFSSSSLAAAAKGITALIRSGGTMQLIASPYLSSEDAAAITLGIKNRNEVITDHLLQVLGQEFDRVVRHRLECLAWLLQHGVLDIKLAIPKGICWQGIYHEKLGIFEDKEGNRVTFTGSANESSAALIDNFECIDVFWSWEPALHARVLNKFEHFQNLWSNQTVNLEVLEFPEAARRSLLKLCPENPSILEPYVSAFSEEYNLSLVKTEIRLKGTPSLPPRLQIRPYQKQAIDNWFANKGRGTLKMATGSGKTITALSLTTELYKKIGLQVLLVVCPYRHLVSQWARECQKFGLEPILAFENVRTWQSKLSTQLYNVRSGNQPFLTVITTNATLMSQGLQSQLPYLPEKTLIVGDEAHNLGARRLEASLPRNVGLRLALSATPERYFDDRGTQSLFDYFGPVLEPEFTLRDAIEQGALVHYLYYPILVELTEQEAQTYAALSIKIGRLLSLGKDQEEDEALKALLMQRSRLVGAAANKLDALRQLMKQRLKTQHTLFYCGDGSVEETSEESRRQLEEVARILGRELGYRINTYTAETSLEEREDLRRQFETGELQGLVAIRCLDEGVDIPAVQTAVIMASSSNPRQFIQRRGRILRRHSNKQRATLFDMIVLPPEMERETIEMERSLLRSELRRFAEFADLADNAGEARLKLLGLQTRYGLLDV